MAEQLTFISPAIIERIENGSFVPARQAKTDIQMGDRRDVLSPLADTKRCIRYEPNVFFHRQPLIITLARALNTPARKIALIGGPQGSGKTSLVRGLIEVMGSSNEQLLWFDVTRHTDFEEIIQFLIQYITYVCAAVGDAQSKPDIGTGNAEEPIRRLEKLINQVSNMPLLLVLDNVEYIVDEELRFNSYPFKEMLNFLLAFPNIKMVLIGERLPYADMSPNQAGVEDIHLKGLDEQDACTWMQAKKKSGDEADPAILERVVAPEAELTALHQLYFKTQGQPWLLKILFYLNHQAKLDFITLNRLLDSESRDQKTPPVAELVRYIYQRLPDQHRRVFQVLAFLRHPVNSKSLLSLVGVCYPVLGPSGLERPALEDLLEHSLLKVVLKIIYPPQEVLSHIRNRRKREDNQGEKKFKPWYELYHTVKRILYASLGQEERDRIHAVLQDVYLREKGLEPANRMLRLKSRALIAEAKYHGSAARERKPNTMGMGGVDLSAEGGLAAKAYISRPGMSGQPKPLTLEDYKNVKLPDSLNFNSDEAETSLEGPTFQELLASSADKLSVQEYMAGLALTDTEKAILFPEHGTETDLPAVIPSPEASAKLVPTEEKALDPIAEQAEAFHQFTKALLAEPTRDEREQVIRKRLAAAVAEQNKTVVARELVELGRYRAGNGRYESACQCLEKALSLKVEAGKAVVAEIHQLLGSVHKETYHHNAALGMLSKAAVEIRRIMYEDDTVNAAWLGRLGKVYQDLGEIYAYRKQTEPAVQAFTQALRWYQSADDPNRLAQVHFELAGVYDDANDPENAILHYQKALQKDEANGNKLSAASSLANLGALYRDSGRWKDSAESFHRSLALDKEMGNMEGQLNTLDSLTGLYLQREVWERAESTARQGLALALRENIGYWKANFYMKLGQYYELQKDWRPALQHFHLAQDTGEQELSKASLDWIAQKIAETAAAIVH